MDSQNLSYSTWPQTAAPVRHHCSNLFPNSFFLFSKCTHRFAPASRLARDNWNLKLSAASSSEALRLLADSESVVKCQVALEGSAWGRARWRRRCWCAAFGRRVQLNEAVSKPQRRTKWPHNDFRLLAIPIGFFNGGLIGDPHTSNVPHQTLWLRLSWESAATEVTSSLLALT